MAANFGIAAMLGIDTDKIDALMKEAQAKLESYEGSFADIKERLDKIEMLLQEERENG